MAYTVLMTVVLVVIFLLMFALVRFTETVIARSTPVDSAAEDGAAFGPGREPL